MVGFSLPSNSRGLRNTEADTVESPDLDPARGRALHVDGTLACQNRIGGPIRVLVRRQVYQKDLKRLWW